MPGALHEEFELTCFTLALDAEPCQTVVGHATSPEHENNRGMLVYIQIAIQNTAEHGSEGRGMLACSLHILQPAATGKVFHQICTSSMFFTEDHGGDSPLVLHPDADAKHACIQQKKQINKKWDGYVTIVWQQTGQAHHTVGAG